MGDADCGNEVVDPCSPSASVDVDKSASIPPEYKAYFSTRDPYKGSFIGVGRKDYGDSLSINLFHEADLSNANFDQYGSLKSFWSVGNDQQFSVEQFKNTGGVPSLYFESEWDNYFSPSDGREVEVRGSMMDLKASFTDPVSFSNVPILCSGDGCVELKEANPEGVDIEFRNFKANDSHELDFTSPWLIRLLLDASLSSNWAMW